MRHYEIHINTMKTFNKKSNKKYVGKMTGFFNVFIFDFLQTFGTLKNHSTNISKDDYDTTADTD